MSLYVDFLIHKYKRAIKKNKYPNVAKELKKELQGNVWLFLDSLYNYPKETRSYLYEQVAGFFLADIYKGFKNSMKILKETNDGDIEYFENMVYINKALPKYGQIVGVEDQTKAQLELCDVACKGLINNKEDFDIDRFDFVASIVDSTYQLTRFDEKLSDKVQIYVKQINNVYDQMVRPSIFDNKEVDNDTLIVAENSEGDGAKKEITVLYSEVITRIQRRTQLQQEQSKAKAADTIKPETSSKDDDNVDQM